MSKNHRFETRQIHVGQESPDPATDARAVPIYATTSYVFKDSEQAAARFALAEPGNIYNRLMNPTADVLNNASPPWKEGRRAGRLHRGRRSHVCHPEHRPGRGPHCFFLHRIWRNVQSFRQYAGGCRHRNHFRGREGRSEFSRAIRNNTKALYVESLGNPNCDIVDMEALAEVAHAHGIPLIVDSTFATPFLFRPLEHGADIVVHSATKFIGGHGTVMGGVIVDGGKFDWTQNDKFPGISKPNPNYHGAVFAEVCGNLAYIVKIRATLLRDTGATISPFNSFLLLQGLETLSLRVERHVQNALRVADYLSSHPQVEK